MEEQNENMRLLTELILGKGRRSSNILYDGGTEGQALYTGKDCVVQRATLAAGTKFPLHIHKVAEVVIVVSGQFHSTASFLTTVTKEAGIIYYPRGVAHSHFAETDCVVIGILIPYGEGYPEMLDYVKDR